MTTKTDLTNSTSHVHFFNYQTGRPRFHFDEKAAGAGADAGADKGAADAGKAADAGAGGAAADAGAKDGGATLLAGDAAAAADAGKSSAPADWPTDWREKLAGGDEKTLKQLQRYNAPGDIWSKARALEQKVSSGELKATTPFPAEADDATKATWRKENGIPEKAEAYEPKVEGLVFGDADKPMLDSFKAHAFGKNWTPGQFNEALGWYAAEQQQIKARQDTADETFRSDSRDSLYTEWGPQDFKANINAVKNLLSSAPTGFADRLLGARLADGKLLGDDPNALKWLSSVAREMNPAATLVPPGTSDAGKSVTAELEAIREKRRNDPTGYDADKKTQARELELLEAVQKMKARAA